jgi:hypothetical protein
MSCVPTKFGLWSPNLRVCLLEEVITLSHIVIWVLTQHDWLPCEEELLAPQTRQKDVKRQREEHR